MPKRTEADLRDKIQKIALQNRFYGYRRICRDLWRLHGLKVNHKHVLRLMREDNLLCLRQKPFVPYTTNSRHEFPIVPNLTRGLVPTGLDQIWVADITYVRLAGQFVYLAVVLDAFSRKVIGWALADHLEASLAIEALDMALTARNPAPGLIHHSDRGVQYACGDYGEKLAERGVLISMSRAGNPYDNAKAERFMRTLKEEEVNGKTYASIDEARTDIGAFSESSIIEAGCIPRSATNPRSSSKPNSANSKSSERTQPKLCHSNPVSQPRGAAQSFGVVGVGPTVERHHVPEMVGRETAEVGHYVYENAFEAFFVERPGEMVVVDQIMLPLEPGDHRHHVRAEEFGQVLLGLLLPGVALVINLLHAQGDLRRPKAQDGRRVENGFAKAHGITDGLSDEICRKSVLFGRRSQRTGDGAAVADRGRRDRRRQRPRLQGRGRRGQRPRLQRRGERGQRPRLHLTLRSNRDLSRRKT